MLPEEAFGLKVGEEIIGTAPLTGVKTRGVVAALVMCGGSVAEYMSKNFTEIEARKLQHDGPSVIMKSVKGEMIIWRPDAVERITSEYVIKCCVCKVIARVQLPLRTFDKMRQGELVVDSPLLRAMIEQSKCGTHCNVGG